MIFYVGIAILSLWGFGVFSIRLKEREKGKQNGKIENSCESETDSQKIKRNKKQF